ncbi:oligoendopeptidase F [Paenibacillus sp. SYP-B3998]|uniref:Oligopeptidase F n=1 Tax=Paenibacillus sp. SYP-B3998 TaxID=2678564 RepID=A0A6G3ZXG3_9BACL|nr:oligoendopeptidase F [Paenibacillus sp. SYP-B3998]NEW06770.1 oligoendopeptidase F [Paenibacillus sp. SYP-B3998]
MKQRPLRNEVPAQLTWNLDELFTSTEAWEAEIEALQADASLLDAYKGTLQTGASQLANCLEAQETLLARSALAATYARLRFSEDSSNPQNQANSARSGDFTSGIGASISFIRSEILALPEGTIEGYLKEESRLEPFRKGLVDLLETKQHQLSAETEAVLASLGEVLGAPYTIYQRSKLSDLSFESVQDADGVTHPVSFALFETDYEFTSNTSLRRASYNSFSKTLEQYQHTFAAVYATEVKRQIVTARLRGYDSATDMLLQPQKVTREMYNNILDVILTELGPHMRRLMQLKKKVLGLDQLLFCDLKAPFDPDFNPSVTTEEASQTILEALRIMGPEYAEIMEQALSERWIDYADNVGKSTGAFCASPYGAHSYILITWGGNMRSAFTLAHELGHAGHLMLAARNQRYTNFRPSLYFIEAPSTMNELLLAEHILKQSNEPRMKRWVILQMLNTYYHNYVTHLLEADMQRRVYAAAEQGEALTAKKLSSLKGDVLTEFWGDTVALDAGANLTWMRQPHYYMGLYPYTYAAGLTASTAVAQLIKAEGQPVVDRWLDVLKAGGTMDPLDLMKLAGVDMSDAKPIQSAVAYVGTLIDELERLF